jgi:hypothetical protein
MFRFDVWFFSFEVGSSGLMLALQVYSWIFKFIIGSCLCFLGYLAVLTGKLLLVVYFAHI